MAAPTRVTGQSPDGARPGGPGRTEGMLSLDDLRREAEAGSIDTVVAAFTDMQGRLMGKRIDASFFLEEVAEHGIEGCDYLLALDMEWIRFRATSWRTGRRVTGTLRLPRICRRCAGFPGWNAPRWC